LINIALLLQARLHSNAPHELALGQQRARRGAGAALAGARRLARLRLRDRNQLTKKFERNQYIYQSLLAASSL
jgi:hypothetical protein